jgi:hypothetical protein
LLTSFLIVLTRVAYCRKERGGEGRGRSREVEGEEEGCEF